MAVEGGMKCVKYLLFFFNFIFWLCGFALIIVGVMVQVSLHKTFMIHDATASAAPIVIITVGVLIFFIAFFGCCGAWKENHCMITTFAVLLSLIIVAEIAAAILGYVFRNKVSVDYSCCKIVTTNCGKNAMTDASKVYQKGCHDVVETFVRNNIQWVIVAAIVIAILQVMGVVFACLLMRSIRSEYEVM
uniref:CD63 molecule n=1 Tax=Kryptolebias marmoratus TaxID=37003 RepID=A0A3Q2ZW37_KRYMA